MLLDTTEQSALGWTKYPDGGPGTRTPGWVEESFTNFERNINWRSFVVCDVAFDSVNNWLWTPFIERGEANRLYIEIKFTMRDCNLFPQRVLSCKETFALLYKEMNDPIESQSSQSSDRQLINGMMSSAANASFAQSDSFQLIDAIAADEGRFTSNTDVVINTEIRSIPVTKRGVYFAFRDQGACLSLISIKVYHLKCPQLSTQFAHFNATPTGKDLTSLVAVEGQCVANSLQIEQPKMFCTADGQWNSMSSGQCKCLAGFEPAANGTKCQACSPGRYKPSLGDSHCLPCPANSAAPFAGASECKCHEGFFRAGKDSRSSPCTQPPGPPHNLSATYVDSSTIILQWSPPKYTGGRDDLTYKLLCVDNCDPSSSLVSSPQFYTNFSETKCILSGLAPSTSYRFVVYAMNGISQLAMSAAASGGSNVQKQQPPQFSEISVQTARPALQTAGNTLSALGNLQLLPVFNFRAFPGARGSDMVLAWDAAPIGSSSDAASSGLDSVLPLDSLYNGNLIGSSSAAAATATGNTQPSLYEIKYQPRYLLASAMDFGGQMRRSPYPAALMGLTGVSSPSLAADAPDTKPAAGLVTTTNKAVSISTLQPRTEYAFQIRAKWPHTNQWTEFSEPIYMFTSNQVPSPMSIIMQSQQQQQQRERDRINSNNNNQLLPPDQMTFGSDQMSPFAGISFPNQVSGNSTSGSGSSSWLATTLLVLLCALISLVLVSLSLIHYRKSPCLQSLGVAGFGQLSGGASSNSTYGGVYGSGGSSDLMGGPLGFNSTTGPVIANGHNSLFHHTLHHAHPNHHHHPTLSSGSAGGLITGSNTTSRSSSGSGNVVQNFIAATLHQISGAKSNHHSHQLNHNHNNNFNHTTLGANQHHHLAGAGNTSHLDGKSLFASPTNGTNQQQQASGQVIVAPPRNHYHQTTINHHLFGQNGNLSHQLANGSQQQQQLQQLQMATQQQQDLFKYRTLGQPGKSSQVKSIPFHSIFY